MPPRCLLVLVAAFFLASPTTAQPTGLWRVQQVTVGADEVTPVARWFAFAPDGTWTGGNGWVQRGAGTWHYDADAATLEATDPNAPVDDYGPFYITLNDTVMTWQREEEGMAVMVTLHQTTEKPLAPWDRAQGLWLLDTVEQDGADLTGTYDPNDDAFVFIRWDRRYVMHDGTSGRRTGLWHIDAHRPILTLVTDDDPPSRTQWTITAEGDQMTWQRTTEGGTTLVRTFRRTRRFPGD